jgi:hypothetical protein
VITRIEYGERWSPNYQDWLNPFSEVEARRRHEARELYTALIEQHDGSRLALEVCFVFSYCNIYFFDDQGRCDLRYTFEPTDDGRLFLCEISMCEYDGVSPFDGRGTHRSFTQEGRMQTLWSENRQLTVLGKNEPVDVRLHYEPVPAFKEWESLIRRARTRPPLHLVSG